VEPPPLSPPPPPPALPPKPPEQAVATRASDSRPPARTSRDLLLRMRVSNLGVPRCRTVRGAAAGEAWVQPRRRRCRRGVRASDPWVGARRGTGPAAGVAEMAPLIRARGRRTAVSGALRVGRLRGRTAVGPAGSA